jgi:predicted ATPase/DNA-binding CsgD family transcriptional regulator
MAAAGRAGSATIASAPSAGWEAASRLPDPLTSLVGRTREIAEVGRLLNEPTVRLVTLTGPGGVGKTRLAQAVAERWQAAGIGDAVVVSLAPIADPELVPATTAQALGVWPSGDRPLVEQLAVSLRGRRLLLVLDNFEQVVGAGPFVAGLPSVCPELVVLVTSRATLRLSGEHVYPVGPLAVPPISDRANAEAVCQSDAGRLFLERARAAKAGFAVTEADAPAVAEIVRRLDGLPLAIELAAARIAVLPPRALLGRLDRRLPLLTDGTRDAPARQRAMRSAIGWSHDLLSEGERVVFRRLAVFAGGCTLAAAEYLFLSVSPSPPPSVLDLVASLVAKSLLGQETDRDGEPRFAMLETIREYALGRLAASGEESEVRRTHAAWFVHLAERAAPELHGPDQARWMRRLAAEQANLRAALVWLLAADRGADALRLIVASAKLWETRPLYAEGRRWLEASLAASPAAPDSLRTAALHAIVLHAGILGDQRTATARAEEALAVACDSDDAFLVGRAHFSVGLAREWAGEERQAAASYARAVPLLRLAEEGSWHWLALATISLGDVLLALDDLDRAEVLADEGLALYRAHGHTWGIAAACGIRANLAAQRGQLAAAAGLFSESVAAARKVGDERAIMGAVAGLAGVAAALGQPERGARLLGAVAAARDAAGAARVMHGRQADRTEATVRARLSADSFSVVWDEGWRLPFELAVADALAIDATAVAVAPATTEPSGAASLTPREREVLRLIVADCRDHEIAAALQVSRRTVNTHVTSILNKLGVESRTAAAVRAVRDGLV